MAEVFQGRTINNLIDNQGIQLFSDRDPVGEFSEFVIDETCQVGEAVDEIIGRLEALFQDG